MRFVYVVDNGTGDELVEANVGGVFTTLYKAVQFAIERIEEQHGKTVAYRRAGGLRGTWTVEYIDKGGDGPDASRPVHAIVYNHVNDLVVRVTQGEVQ